MSAGREPVMSRPLNRMRPPVGVRKCVSRLKQVVFPAPLGPMSAWIVPRRTRKVTFFTATNPRNSLESPSVSRMRSSAISRPPVRRRIEPRLALLAPRPIGLVHLPRGDALGLRQQDFLEDRARIAVERFVEQSLGVGRRGGPRALRLCDDRSQRALEVARRAHPVDETDRARFRRAHVIVQERQLLGTPDADHARQPEHGAVGDKSMTRGAESEDGVVGGQAQITRERQLQAAADRVAVQHGDGDLRHVFEAIERPAPVPIERLADRAGRERGSIHPRAERAPGSTHDHLHHARVAGGGLDVIGERCGELGGQRVENFRPVQRDPADAVPGFVGDRSRRHRERLGHQDKLSTALTRLYDHRVPMESQAVRGRSAKRAGKRRPSAMPVITRRRFVTTALATGATPLFPRVVRAQTAVKIGSAVLGDYSMAGPVIVALDQGLFKAEGLAAEVVPFRGGADAQLAAMTRNEIAAYVWGDGGAVSKLQGKSKVLMRLDSVTPKWISQIQYASEDAIARQGDAIRKSQRALFRALKLMRDNPREAAGLVSKKLGWSPEAVLDAHKISGPVLPVDGSINVEALGVMQDTLLEYGLIKKKLPLDAHYTREFTPVNV